MLVNQMTAASAIADRAVAGTTTDPASGEAFSLPLSEAEDQPKISEREAIRAKTEELLKKLNDYINKGPVVALREQILKSMGLTEADLKSLPPEKQAAIEKEIEQKIKEFLLKRKEQGEATQTATATPPKAGTQSAKQSAQTIQMYTMLNQL